MININKNKNKMMHFHKTQKLVQIAVKILALIKNKATMKSWKIISLKKTVLSKKCQVLKMKNQKITFGRIEFTIMATI